MKIFVFLAIFVALCYAQTGKSYCNSGACAVTTDCDLGFCCGGKCVSAPTSTLAKGATCNISNSCAACPTGQYCDYLTTSCTDDPAVTCKYTYGCKCSAGSDCISGFCASDSQCRNTNLNPGDVCVDDVQCGSSNCTGGICIGKNINDTCNAADYQAKECAYGLACTYVGINQQCVQGNLQGANCSLSSPCSEAWSDCDNGKCGEMYSGAVGDACLSVLDCSPPNVCTSQKCAAQTTGNCNILSCGLNQACGCSGTTGTKCAQSYNWCATQYTAVATCLRKNQCSNTEATAWNDDSCAMKNCQSALIAESCCRYCGTGSQNFVSTPLYGLNCVTNKYTLTQVCDGTCQTAYSSCASSSGAASTTSGPTGGESGDASSVAASIVLIIAMIAMLL